MSILSVCQDAAVTLNQAQPSSIFSSAGTFATELRVVANDAARAIAQYYDWRKLTKLATLQGDAVTLAFDLPADYDRMPKKARVHSKVWQTATFNPVKDLDQWIYLQDVNIAGNPGSWIVLGGQMQIFPVIASTETARFYYITKNIVSDDKETFTLDADRFLLSETVLKLGIIWRWRASKRLEYAEDLKNYEIAIDEEIVKDKGSNILVAGEQRYPTGINYAYPGVLGP